MGGKRRTDKKKGGKDSRPAHDDEQSGFKSSLQKAVRDDGHEEDDNDDMLNLQKLRRCMICIKAMRRYPY